MSLSELADWLLDGATEIQFGDADPRALGPCLCVRQLAPNKDGYVPVNYKGKMRLAHRIVYRVFVGRLPKYRPGGLQVNHVCGMGHEACVNPAHLVLAPQKRNADHREEMGRGNHAKGGRHGNAKLTESEVKEIRELYATGFFSQQGLGDLYGVAANNISHIISRRAWRHV